MATSAQSGPELFHWVEVTNKPLDVAAASDFVGTPESGAAVLFLGTVRNHAPGKNEVSHLRLIPIIHPDQEI